MRLKFFPSLLFTSMRASTSRTSRSCLEVMDLDEPSWAVGKRKGQGTSDSKGAKQARLLAELGQEAQANQKNGKGGALAALLVVLTKLALTNARELAEVTGACFTSYMVGAEVPFVKVLQETGKTYAENCKADGKDHQHGPPWPHVFKAFIKWACSTEGASTTPAAAQTVFQDYWKKVILSPSALETLAIHCRHFRLKACWYDKKKLTKPDRFKLQIMLGIPQQANPWGDGTASLMEAVQQTVMAAGTDKKDQTVRFLPGAPPRGGLEREASKLLAQLGMKDKPAAAPEDRDKDDDEL